MTILRLHTCTYVLRKAYYLMNTVWGEEDEHIGHFTCNQLLAEAGIAAAIL